VKANWLSGRAGDERGQRSQAYNWHDHPPYF
jgi:hypothetical protein